MGKVKQKFNDTELDDYFTWVKAVWISSRNEPLDFEEHKYLIGIYQDQHPYIIIQKSAQSGVSERLISESVWVCDRLNKNTLYTFPTSSQLTDFVQGRLEPVFNYSDYLSRITGVLSSDEKKERNVDQDRKIQKVGLKQIRNAFMYLRGSQNQQQIISVDADMIVLDERDRFIQEHVSYIDKRLMHSTLKWRREASTPTLPGKYINEAYLASDQRLWMLTCTKCNLEQELDFFYNINFDKKITICKQCREPIDRLKMGRWVPQNPTNIEVHGYKINGIYNPRKSVEDMINDYEKARNSGFSAIQQFYNQVLGMPYEVAGQTLLRSEMENCTSDYRIPYESTGCFSGADVGSKINVIVSKMIGERNRYVWIGTVSEFLGPVDSLEALILKFGIQRMVVDAKPETRKVKELIDKYPGKVIAAYYPSRKFDVQNYYTFDDFKSEVYIDRTISLDYLVSDIQNDKIELPENAKHIPEFYEQMVASTRAPIVNPRTGAAEFRWIEKGADHFFHAANYNRIATLRGTIGQALLDSYGKKSDDNNKSILPGSIAGWANLVRMRGIKV